jgi:hypothetical protein
VRWGIPIARLGEMWNRNYSLIESFKQKCDEKQPNLEKNNAKGNIIKIGGQNMDYSPNWGLLCT